MPVHDWRRVEAGLFHHFHLLWVAHLSDALNGGLLPGEYYALAEQRACGVEPDVVTLKRTAETAQAGVAAEQDLGSGAIALAEAPPKVAFVENLDTAYYVRQQRSIAIRHVSEDELVALIEILSPGNKSSRAHLKQFVEKVVAAIESRIHVLVIDLHPPTARDPRGIHGAIAEELGRDESPFDPQHPLTLVSYLADSEPRAYLQPIALGEELPPMPLFLDPYTYINVPLESTYNQAFQSVPRHLRAALL
jgi:hypothetical protein